jgi:predicted nucleic acid-binding protein
MTLVVDASVIVRSVLPEAGTELAKQVIRRTDLHAPRQAWLETANAFRRRVGSGSVGGSAAEVFLRALPGLISLHADEALGERAFELAVELDHEIYDCLYLALAVALDCPLITADVAFAAKARRRHRAVVALADWR